jgi:hypothetical protein
VVKGVWIYVEGGGAGKGSKDGKIAIRQGFSRFFGDGRVHVVPCGARDQAYKDFKRALETNPERTSFLLVDSEESVSATPWQHLLRQSGDQWEKPSRATDEQCHLMVRMVEAWLVADPDTLASFYGKAFLRKALPSNVDIEAVSKADVMKALDHATSPTQKGKYHKIAHCSKLLAQIDKEQVRLRAKHCDRLLKTLEQNLS